MRGRTNVTQRKAPYVNGDIIQATVESGTTVYTGDFVEYKLQSAVEQSDIPGYTDSATYYHHKDFMSNYLLVLDESSGTNSGYLELWNKVSKTRISRVSISFSSSNQQYMYYDIMDDNKILLVTYKENGVAITNVKVYCIAFENSQLVIKDFKSFNVKTDFWESAWSSGNVLLYGLCKVDSQHFAILTINSNVNNIVVSVIGYSQGTIGNVIENTVLSHNISTVSQYKQNVSLNLTNKKIGFAIKGQYVYYGVIDFDNLYSATLSQIQTVGNSSLSDFTNIGVNCIVAVQSYLVAYLLCYNSISNGFTSIQFNPKIYSSTSGESILIRLDENLALLSSKKEHVIIRFDEEGNEVYVTNKLSFGLSTDTVFTVKVAFIDSIGNVSGYNMKVNNYKANFSYSEVDNELDAGVDTNYVKPYAGGKAIGFAKTSGNAGNIVSVYVPHNS